ncbi:Multicopper oxidase [Phytophthora megakarya]|uniref:Multicopper oxidase n=1 Tax=Phytophthora megakarya TaxID=4795 RepID=A0A225WNX4_9STRA|nr:Multicopper oxidase [Phytophthora megakarya]
MHLLTRLSLLLLGSTQASSRVVRYDWNITTLNTTIFDGVRGRLGYGINNEPSDQHPIEVTFGDEVEVHVTNQLTEQTCIHWHGLRQFGTQEMDGVSGITQCQIQPGVTAIYRYKPDKCGTFWFHGHEEVQYAYGLRGPLIVHCPAKLQQSWEKDVYKEYTILLADWYHDLPVGAPIWDTVLINNVGRYNCTVAEAAGLECGPGRSLPRFQFVPGKKYLLRLINTSAMAAFKVSLDGHTFQVVASDADYLKPSTPVNSVMINVAQRYDILVQAKSSPTQGQSQISQKKTVLGSYWLRVDSQYGLPWTARLADQVPEGFNPNALAIIDYETGATAEPTSSAWTTEVSIPEFDYTPAVPVTLPTTPDQRIVVEFTLAVLDANPGAFLGYISLNEANFSSLVIPDSPPLFTIARGINTEDLPVTANAIKLKHNDHVEVVVVNETPDQHPFHLHAHSPYIVGSGQASRENILAGNLTALRLNGPMQHDVFTVPECKTDAAGACTDLGYVVYRLNADNPGVWMMHCHIDWHFVLGLGMLFVEAEDELHKEGLAAFSPNMLLSVCKGNFTTV